MDVHLHVAITRAALARQPAIGRGAAGLLVLANGTTDLAPWHAAWHVDSAPDRAAVWAIWQHGLRPYLDRAVALLAAGDAPGRPAVTPWAAWWALGRATHIVQDFYAHTNWVELHERAGCPGRLAPLHERDCAVEDLPAGLTSGFFSLRYFHPGTRFSGCPMRGGHFAPPPPFRFCHVQLAKDNPKRGHGGERLVASDRRYGEVACAQALAATVLLLRSVIRPGPANAH
jgi:hypothetical protein